MSVTYSVTAKTARMAAVVSAIGAGGKLKLFDVSNALLATFTLAATAGVVSGAGPVILTLSDANGAVAGILNTTASAGGIAVKASITTSADVDVLTNTLTVGMSGTDRVLDNNEFVLGQAITITSGVIAHA